MNPTVVDDANVKKQTTAVAFDRFVERYLKDCLRAVSLPLMLKIFEPIIPQLKSEIEEYHKQGEEYMLQEFKKGLYKIIEARDLIQKQNKLDKLKQEAKDRDQLKQETKGKDQKKVLLVPTPTQVFMGVVYKEKQAELIRLQNMLDQMTEENYALMNKVELLNKEKSDKETRVKEEVGRFNKCIEIANSISTEDLIELMKEIDLKNPRI